MDELVTTFFSWNFWKLRDIPHQNIWGRFPFMNKLILCPPNVDASITPLADSAAGFVCHEDRRPELWGDKGGSWADMTGIFDMRS